MLTYALAVLSAVANATSWVLQRKANREVPKGESLTLKLMNDLARRPVWFGGIAAIAVGFVLQAAALDGGALAIVETILVLELPFTLLLGSQVFGVRMHHREWLPIALMTVGVGLLLFLLSPTPGMGEAASWYVWILTISANLGLIAVLVAWSQSRPLRAPRSRLRRPGAPLSGQQRAAVLGIAAGSAFGLTAALMKGMTGTIGGGAGALFSSWQLYAMVAAGGLGMFLTQSALNAGRLVASQPGISLMDPIISVLWGVLVFREQVRGGLLILPELACVAVIGVAAVMLARSPMLEAQ